MYQLTCKMYTSTCPYTHQRHPFLKCKNTVRHLFDFTQRRSSNFVRRVLTGLHTPRANHTQEPKRRVSRYQLNHYQSSALFCSSCTLKNWLQLLKPPLLRRIIITMSGRWQIHTVRPTCNHSSTSLPFLPYHIRRNFLHLFQIIICKS